MESENQCKKKDYLTLELAKEAAKKINKEGAEKNGIKVQMRAYKCKSCAFYHITSMKKGEFSHIKKFKEDLKYRNKVREDSFIKRESDYWNRKFGIED
jgi:uncharacterized GH25 family protein